MDLYADTILDHYHHPRLKEELPDASITHTENNPTCGDTVTLQLRMGDDDTVTLRWTGDGCAISQAAMSMLAELVDGKTLTEIDTLTGSDILELLHVPVGTRRLKCALLSIHTLQNTLRKHRHEQPQPWTETVGNATKTS